MMRKLLLLTLATFAGPAAAAQLEFDGLTAETNVTSAPHVSCQQWTAKSWNCRLTRIAIGDVPIQMPTVSINPATLKPTSILFVVPLAFERRAIDTLILKYGQPRSDVTKAKVNPTGGPYQTRTVTWDGFDGGADVHLTRLENSIVVGLRFPQNFPSDPPPKVDF